MSTFIMIVVKFGVVHRRSILISGRTTTEDPARVPKGGYYGKALVNIDQ